MFSKFVKLFSTSAGGSKKLFDRVKHISNRQFAMKQNVKNIFVNQSIDTLMDNISSIRKQYDGNIAYFGQGAIEILKNPPNNFIPKNIYLCDIHEDLLTNTLDQIKNDSEIAKRVNIQFLDEVSNEDDRITIIPICCDEELWPFPENHFQLIVSNMNLHWVNDLPVVLIKWLESLEADGTLVGSMFGADTLQELRIAYTLAENERYGGVSSHVSPFITISEIGNLLTRFNYTLPTICTERNQYEFDSVFHLMQYIQDIGEGEALLQKRQGVFKQTIESVSAIYESLFRNENKKVNCSFEQIYFSAWKYHESQSKPKARGSASISLQQLQQELKEIDPNQKMDFGTITEEDHDDQSKTENDQNNEKK